MPLVCFIPIDISLDGKSCKGLIQYDSSYLRKYSTDVWKFVDRCFEEFEATDTEKKQAIIILVSDLLTRVSKFWLEKVLRPLSKELDFPYRTVCRCNRSSDSLRRCAHDLITYSHYDDINLSRIKVDLFSGPPSISINVACQEDSDIERYKKYYTLLVKRFHELPCCRCCPISRCLVREIEDHVDETENTISLIKHFVDEAPTSSEEEKEETSV